MGMNYQSSLTDTFTKIIILATITTLVPYAFAAAAQLMLMFREPERFSGRRLAVDATVAILAFAYSFWMIYGAGQEYIAQGFLLLLAGIPVYVYLKWRQAVAALSRRSRPRLRPRAPRSPSGMVHCRKQGRSRTMPQTHAISSRPDGERLRRSPHGACTPRSGRCGRVLLHRPGLELKRLTPRTRTSCSSTTCSGSSAPARSTTSSPTPWPSGASRCSTSRQLLAETLESEAAHASLLERTTRGRAPWAAAGRRASGVARRRCPRLSLAETADRRHRLRRAALPQPRRFRRALRRRGDFVLRAAAQPPVHARHVGLGLRRRVRQPHGQAGPCARGDQPRRSSTAHHPIFAEHDVPGLERLARLRPRSLEGGDVLVIGNGCVLIGMGERTRPSAVEELARAAVRGRGGPAGDRGRCCPSGAPRCTSTRS